MKRWVEPITSAWSGILGHKLRSFLTILGVVIGVSAVITLMSVGKGTTSRVVSSIQSLGANVITIRPGFTTSGGVRGAFGSASTLTMEDAQAIQGQIENVLAVAPSTSRFYQAVYGSENLNVSAVGTTVSYLQTNNITVAEGDFFSEYEYQHNARVVVLGSTVKETLFGDEDAVGKTIRLGSYRLEVVGVLAAKGSSMSSPDSSVILPLTTLQQMGGITRNNKGYRIISSITVAVTDQKYSSQVKQDITELLRERHELTADSNDDFTITSMEDIINQLTEVSNYMTILLGAIAGISLLVGGIGVMNIMLVSVIERTREIGIRKALGARESDIWGQFLIEAVMLTFTGGIIGVGIGWGASIMVSKMLTTTVITADIIALAVSVAVAIGVFFGFYPAWQASRLNPIEALRHE